MSSSAPAKKRFQALAPGMTVAERYAVRHVLGQGGMGQVVEVEHVALGRRFALKVLRLERWNDELVRRFNREARALGSLSTARVAQVTDFGVDEHAGPFYVMELLEGETLEDRLERLEKVPAREALHIAAELCEALADVHEAGIVHRDLKPSNVGLPSSGPVLVKLLDFGLAASMDDAFLSKITQSQQILGSLPYMAPEQFNGAAPAISMDLYAVGIVLYESITGRLPFMAPAAAAMIHQILSMPMPPLGPDAAAFPHLDALLERFLAKEPTARFANAKAASQAIRDVLGRDAAPATRMGIRPGVPNTSEREASTPRAVVGHLPTLIAESGTRLSGVSPDPMPHPAPVHAVPPTPIGGTVPMHAGTVPMHAGTVPMPVEASAPGYGPYAVAPYPAPPAPYPVAPAASPPSGLGVRLALAAIVGIVFAGLTAIAVAVGLSLLDDDVERPPRAAVAEPAATPVAAPEPLPPPLQPAPAEPAPSVTPAPVAPAPTETPREVEPPGPVRTTGTGRRIRDREEEPPPLVRPYPSTAPPPRPPPQPPPRDPSVIRTF